MKEVEGLLTHMESTATQDDEDPRLPSGSGEEPNNQENEESKTSLAAKTFASEKELRKEVEVTAETKAQCLPTLRMLRDAKNNIYLVATADSMTLPTKWSVLGSYGPLILVCIQRASANLLY